MPFVLKKYPAKKAEPLYSFLRTSTSLTLSHIQKYLAKGRVFDMQNIPYKHGDYIKDDAIQIAEFVGSTRGLKPLFINQDFALFDKPSGVMIHPISRDTRYTLLDEVRYHFGELANTVHRIDSQTSGLVLVSLHKKSEKDLKQMFERREIKKTYKAVVKSKVLQPMVIDTPIDKDSDSLIRIKMKASLLGKESLTQIYPLHYNKESDTTLILAIPYTGRQHQLRVHLDFVGHPILGDPIYGVDEEFADRYLNKHTSTKERFGRTGASRLMLQANTLEFTYKDIYYNMYSKLDFR